MLIHKYLFFLCYLFCLNQPPRQTDSPLLFHLSPPVLYQKHSQRLFLNIVKNDIIKKHHEGKIKSKKQGQEVIAKYRVRHSECLKLR